VTTPSDVLILTLAPISTVLRTADQLRRCYPRATMTFAVSEGERWKLEEAGCRTWTVGERTLPLDQQSVRRHISERFDLVAIPLGVPRQSLLPAARLARHLRENVRTWWVGSRTCSWRLVMVVLACYNLLVWLPVASVLAGARLLDAALLLCTSLVARAVPPKARDSEAAATAPVCHVINSLGTGGAQRQLVEYCRCSRLRHEGRLVVIALFEDSTPYLPELQRLGVTVDILYQRLRRKPLQHLFGRVFRNMTMVFELRRRLRQLEPGCSYSWLFEANVIAAPAARLARLSRTCCSIRNLSDWKTWPQTRAWWYHRADWLSARLVATIVANSQTVASDYARWARIDANTIRVIANGVDVDRLFAAPTAPVRDELGIPPDGAVVLTVGRLAPEKNQAMLVRSFHQLLTRLPSAHLVVVGHGEKEHELRDLVSALGCQEQVHMVGKAHDTASYYRAADVFGLTSRIEGMPNVVLEAQAFGLPVVTTRCGGAVEIVVHNRTGVVVDTHDENAFTQALLRLLTDRELRTAMGGAGAARVRAEFSVEAMAAALDCLTDAGAATADGDGAAPSNDQQPPRSLRQGA